MNEAILDHPETAPTINSRIDTALLALMARGDSLNHDAVAAGASISRRTVYRRFPDQKALRKRVWELLSPPGALAGDLAHLLNGGIIDGFLAFEREAPAMTVTMASAEGRAIRNQIRDQRTEYYRGAFGEALDDIPEPTRTQIIAVLQLLCSGLAWREFREQWGLVGEEAGGAARWAVAALLAAAQASDLPAAA